MPERHLLDILKHAEHWARYTRHFGPPSGSDPKLAQAVQRYLFTVFGYGCNLGPGQTARHAPEIASAQALRRINAQHINADKLEAAMVDVIDQYARFPLPRHWGSGRAAIADGTHVKLRENNLLGSQHIRYGAYGGIAYHHIADSYIALFTSFIPCGVWEAVHILDGLLKNRSEIQPDTLHADTQGQSEPVFGLCRLLGIKLMPRMRGLSDVTFYRPAKSIRYEHIDALFTGDIDWDLIATHARDMIQVVLSIQAGRVMPSMLLRKLGTYNRRSLLYRAFRELGRVERTLFLLRYISNIEVRRVIRAETTKIEAYNDFLDWVSFGGPVIKSGDPVEQEKQLKYASLVANTIMLSNVADMTTVLSDMAADGHAVTPALVACLSPYIARAHPPLRPIRSRHGRPAGTARSAAAPVRADLVTTFYTYPEPTPDGSDALQERAPTSARGSRRSCGRRVSRRWRSAPTAQRSWPPCRLCGLSFPSARPACNGRSTPIWSPPPALIVLGGRAADQFGVRLASIVGLALFAVASCSSGIAPSRSCTRRGMDLQHQRPAVGVDRGVTLAAQHFLAGIITASLPEEQQSVEQPCVNGRQSQPTPNTACRATMTARLALSA